MYAARGRMTSRRTAAIPSLILLFGMLLIGDGISWHVALLPPFLVLQACFTLGIGLMVATFNTWFRDMGHWVEAALRIGMFVTPVFWYPELMQKFGPDVAALFEMNPAAHLVQAQRIALGAVDVPGKVVFGDLWQHLGVTSLWAVVLLTLGYGAFTSRSHRYADLV